MQTVEARFLRAIPLADQHDTDTAGIAISRCGTWLAMSHPISSRVSVHTLSTGALVDTLGGGDGKSSDMCRLVGPQKLCFTRRTTLLVADSGLQYVVEVSLDGLCIRSVGKSVINSTISGVATNDIVIVVCKSFNVENGRLFVFDDSTGALVRVFGDYGPEPGQLTRFCGGVSFLRPTEIVVSEKERLSVFRLDGSFVAFRGVGDVRDIADVAVCECGDVIVVDESPSNIMFVYSGLTGRFLASCGGEGAAEGKFQSPAAVAWYAGHAYVVEFHGGRIQVFQ